MLLLHIVEYYMNRTESQCKEPCHAVRYDLTLSHSQYPSDAALKYLAKSGVSENELK